MRGERRGTSGGCGQLALGSRLTRVTCSQYDNHAPRVSFLSEYSESREGKALSYSGVLNRIHSCHIAKSTFRSNARQGKPENMSDVERKDDLTNWPKQNNAGMWKSLWVLSSASLLASSGLVLKMKPPVVWTYLYLQSIVPTHKICEIMPAIT